MASVATIRYAAWVSAAAPIPAIALFAFYGTFDYECGPGLQTCQGGRKALLPRGPLSHPVGNLLEGHNLVIGALWAEEQLILIVCPGLCPK